MSKRPAKPKPATEATPEPQTVVARFQQVLADVERGALSLAQLDQVKGALQSWSRRLDVRGLSERLSALRTGRKPEFGKARPAAPARHAAKPARTDRSDPSKWPIGGASPEPTTTHRERQRMQNAYAWFSDPSEAEVCLSALVEYDELHARGLMRATERQHATLAVERHRRETDRALLAKREWTEHNREQAALAAKAEHELRVKAEAESRVRAAQERVAAAEAERAEALAKLKNR